MTNVPNILILMADQMTPSALPFHGNRAVKAPVMAKLAAAGVVFESAYCNSPLCAPSRAILMSGRLPSKTGAFDNAAAFPTETPTFAHYLRAAGYRTILTGKMHFCGTDQLHGFEERLTTDIYPADYGWTPDWAQPDVRQEWYHNMGSVLEAGVAVRTNQLDFDEEVVFTAERKLYDLARDKDRRPFCMTVSLTHPHDPFAIPERYWNLYEESVIEPPRIPAPSEPDPHMRRLRFVSDMDDPRVTFEHVLRARRAYLGAISYVDEQFGRVLDALERTGFSQDTIVVLLSDHGEMLGEHGLWYKMSFLEGSARIPLVIKAPGLEPRRVKAAVSAIDLLPTLAEIAGVRAFSTPLEGQSLVPHLHGRPGPDLVLGEYLAEGVVAPMVMIRRGGFKFIHCPGDPDQLFALDADPDETSNLADDQAFADVLRGFKDEVARRWDLEALDRQVRESQQRRLFVDRALAVGTRTGWDWEPPRDATMSYIRSHMDLDDLEARARFPRIRP
ncbi:choline-sulfatase [Arboricoccus pini]|uniref:Choline-sulfatase n=1 Tax=Arboricoccus pini TaxID=1963835 RepID=A0A212RZX5_9PROT|nr:choline-sulfatase [Arboricoccus pini]SNB78363.1 choline-sulfatase [Arboricoccus pini]